MDTLSPLSQESNPQKQCTKCKLFFPATLEFFFKDKSRKDGLYSRCKSCESKREKARRRSINMKPEVTITVPDGQKRCAKCENVYPATPEFFYRARQRKDGLYSYCKVCNDAIRHDPEERKKKIAYNHAYYRNEENRTRIKAQTRAYYRSHHSEAREKAKIHNQLPEVREYRLAYFKEYNKRPEIRERDREARNIAKKNRRAHAKAIAGSYTNDQIRDLLKRQKHKCYYCCQQFEKRDGKYIYHIDHTYPINRVVGTDIPANDIAYLVLACPSCNHKKSDKFPWEFPEGGRLL
jgi:Pyruvate/2-oxoacid:ferredoxin oxidoreductase delta subunit